MSLWQYVSFATKAATDYVGITTKNRIKQRQQQQQPSLNKNVTPNLYDEINIDCLNFLANLLDSSRPKLNNNNINYCFGENILNLMEKNYIILIEVLTFLSFSDIIILFENKYIDKSSQLSLSLNYLLFNDLSGYKYIRGSCHIGLCSNSRIFLVCNKYEIIKYYDLYNKYIHFVDDINHSIITKDIDRTLIISDSKNNKHNLLTIKQKEYLKNILSIYCILDGQCGYIQGMNYIVANILIACNNNVHNAFAIFCHFMKRDLSPPYIHNNNITTNDNTTNNNNTNYIPYAYCGGGKLSKTNCIGYGLRDLYLPSLPGLIISLLQFESLIKLYLPSLYQHFVSQGISVQNYASEWFLSLFCYILPLKLSLRIIDIFIIDGWKILFRAGLALLFKAKFKILSNNLSFDKILLFLKRKDIVKLLFNDDYDLFIDICMKFKVTNRMLHETAVILMTKSMIDNNIINKHKQNER